MDKIMLFDKESIKILYCTKYEKEYELQELVKDHPTIIEIKSIFDSPLLIIGRETLRIDVLGITLSGVPVIIECKRKENPDMRYLIAQIFEYGSILRTKTFEELESYSRDYFKSEKCKENKYKNKSLIEALNILKEEHPEFDDSTEDDIQNTIYKNLENGNFFLLIVADEIDEISRSTIDFLNLKLNDIHIEIVEIKKYVKDCTSVFVPQHTNPVNKSSLQTRKTVGKTTLEEMKNKGSAKQIEAVNRIVQAWQNKENCYIEMGTTGLSMRFNEYSIFWLFINKIQISPYLKKQLGKNNKSLDILDIIKKLLNGKTIIETEEIDISWFYNSIDEIHKKLMTL
jgi:hypothetical protein